MEQPTWCSKNPQISPPLKKRSPLGYVDVRKIKTPIGGENSPKLYERIASESTLQYRYVGVPAPTKQSFEPLSRRNKAQMPFIGYIQHLVYLYTQITVRNDISDAYNKDHILIWHEYVDSSTHSWK